MKTIKISALLVALLMLASCVLSCGSTTTKTVNCTLSVYINGEFVIEDLAVPVKTEGDEQPTVLKALEIALQFSNYQYECDTTNLKRVVVDGVEYAAGYDADGTKLWFWNYTANGVEPEQGSPAINLVNEGDVIIFAYTSIPVENSDSTDTSAEDVEEVLDEAEG